MTTEKELEEILRRRRMEEQFTTPASQMFPYKSMPIPGYDPKRSDTMPRSTAILKGNYNNDMKAIKGMPFSKMYGKQGLYGKVKCAGTSYASGTGSGYASGAGYSGSTGSSEASSSGSSGSSGK